MENKIRWSFRQHCLLSLTITALTIITDIMTGSFGALSIIISMKSLGRVGSVEASAIGIIGGVDGPTALFYSGNPFNVLIVSKAILLIILLLLFKPVKKCLRKMVHN